MTALSERKTRLVIITSDEVRECGKYRPVVVEAHPMHAKVKLKGMRGSFDIPWAAVYSMAAKMEANRVRMEKQSKRGVK